MHWCNNFVAGYKYERTGIKTFIGPTAYVTVVFFFYSIQNKIEIIMSRTMKRLIGIFLATVLLFGVHAQDGK